MTKRTTGTIVSAKRQWWLKVNTKAVRRGPLDGARFPYIVQVRYTVDGVEYTKRKWIGTQYPVPHEGDTVELVYEEDKPEHIQIVW
ncbi:MAG: sugar ABC transporter permease [Erysipelotrichales bacterium]|nr:sugar ABC transporter permease [Erysipelotrichales bacterium]MBQ4011263.1 sugar ABC transporter permease [Erysipelotrichales bacterium]